MFVCGCGDCLFLGGLFFCLSFCFGFVSLFFNQELPNVFSTNTSKPLKNLMPLKRDLEFFHLLKVVTCWPSFEMTPRCSCPQALGRMQSLALHLGPLLQISQGSSATKTPPGKRRHARQPGSPELFLLRRRAARWGKKPLQRLLCPFATAQQQPVLQFPLE